MNRHRESHERAPLPGAGYVEDYTTPFLVVAGVLCFLFLFALWAAWGLGAPLVFGFLADRLMPQG